MSLPIPEVSIVLPCLNEEKTLASCIRAAHKALKDGRIAGEVIVADNGSTDRSAEIAVEEGARLIRVPAKGYGNALYHGFSEARGHYLIHLDADMSYEFAHIPRFVEKLRQGADFVMGSRLRGRIYPGAMPWSHRYIGTPVLTTIANLFFKCRITDINCGMRGLTKEAFQRLGLRSGGMEFASEMIVKAAALKMNIVEIPTDLKPDERDRKPHLSSFRDGWRHLRFLLLFCPAWLFVWPGLMAGLVGASVMLGILFNLIPHAGMFSCLAAMALTVLGLQIILLGLGTRGFAQLRRLRVRETTLDRFFASLTLEKGILSGGVMSVAGVAVLTVALTRIMAFMNSPDYSPQQLDVASTKLALMGTTLLVAGIQIIFSSFFLGLFSIEPVSREARAPGGVWLNLNLGVPLDLTARLKAGKPPVETPIEEPAAPVH